MEKVIVGQEVLTPYGKATVTIVDNDSKVARVKHRSKKMAVTDFRFEDLKETKTKQFVTFKKVLMN